jgi:hypothetical protein
MRSSLVSVAIRCSRAVAVTRSASRRRSFRSRTSDESACARSFHSDACASARAAFFSASAASAARPALRRDASS